MSKNTQHLEKEDSTSSLILLADTEFNEDEFNADVYEARNLEKLKNGSVLPETINNPARKTWRIKLFSAKNREKKPPFSWSGEHREIISSREYRARNYPMAYPRVAGGKFF